LIEFLDGNYSAISAAEFIVAITQGQQPKGPHREEIVAILVDCDERTSAGFF
jgi:hypothetical protein